MILNKEVEITVNSTVMKHFKNFGYTVYKNCRIVVNVEHLNVGSHIIIDAQCDICKNSIKKLEYRNYIKATKYDGLYYCRENKCFSLKVRKTTFEWYGVYSANVLEEKKQRQKATTFERYGVENAFQSEEIKEKIRQHYRDNFNGAEWNTQTREVKEKNGWLLDDNLIGFEKYSKEVRKLTSRNKKQLLENWDGYDYYDGEYIKSYFNLSGHNPNYPTLDHKISLKHGYINNIDVDVISDISNLCFTKRYINSNKRTLTESEFKLLK